MLKKVRVTSSSIGNGLVTSAMICELTGCTKKDIMRFTAKNLIRAVHHNAKGYALYDEDALRVIREHLRKGRKASSSLPDADFPYSSQTAVEVFRHLKEGTQLDDILLKTGLHPRTLRSILREYENLTGCIIVYAEFVKKMNQLTLDGDFPLVDGAGIYDVMRLAAEIRQCRTCQMRTPSENCSVCERRKVLKNITRVQPGADSSNQDQNSSSSLSSVATQPKSTHISDGLKETKDNIRRMLPVDEQGRDVVTAPVRPRRSVDSSE